ncbi:MAG TPA: type II toxin-antitoxin system VapC family toxin [Pseudomonadales bacterium]
MRFWDSSAIVPLLVDEAQLKQTRAQLEHDSAMLVWWGTPVECVSALARRERDGSLESDGMRIALQRLRALAEQWHEVLPTSPLRASAERMLRVHPLRAGDALQLAAALVAAERDPPSLEFVTLDDRLRDAASKEGFRVV